MEMHSITWVSLIPGLRELPAHTLVEVVGNAAFGEFRDGFRPGKSGTLTRNEQGRFPPDGDMVEPQLALAVDLCFLDMHVETEGAAIDLRSPDMDEIADLFLDGAVRLGHAEVGKLLEQLGRLLGGVQALCHG